MDCDDARAADKARRTRRGEEEEVANEDRSVDWRTVMWFLRSSDGSDRD